jgi:uncharacterized protein YecT (DUF1311 family)
MKTILSTLMLCGCVLLIDGPSSAQEDRVDCSKAVSQAEINECAQADYQAADKALNEQWPKTKKVLTEWDAELEPHNKGAVEDLMSAQRAWITYRDAHCNAVGYSVWGGSLYQAVVLGCLADVTRARTAQLMAIIEPYGN